MNSSRLTLICALFLAAPALAQDDVSYLLLERALNTGHVVDLYGDDSAGIVGRKLEELYSKELRKAKRALGAQGGRLLAAGLREHAPNAWDVLDGDVAGPFVKDGPRKIHRRRGQLVALIRAPVGVSLTGILSGARRVAPRALIDLELSARDLETGADLGQPQSLRVTLEELDAIRHRPAAVKHTVYGALLRRAWRGVLKGTPDDSRRIEARIRVRLNGIPLAQAPDPMTSDREAPGRVLETRITLTRVTLTVDGFELPDPADQPVGGFLPKTRVDLALGRRLTGREWFRNLTHRAKPLTDLDDTSAARLADLLDHARADRDWPGWTRLRAGTVEAALAPTSAPASGIHAHLP